MLQVGGYPNSSNVTNVKTAYTFVNGEKKYFWKDKTIYDNYWNDNYYSRIIYAFLLNNSTNNTLRVVYLDDSDAIKTKDFTLPNVTGYKNRGIRENYDFQVNGNSLLIVLKYTDPSRTTTVTGNFGSYQQNPDINKLFYISDILTSLTVIDINFDDGVLGVNGNSYEVEYYRLAQYGIWLTLAKAIGKTEIGTDTYEYNTYFIPLPNKNVTVSDAYKKNLWSPVGKTITHSIQSNTIGGRLLYCIFDNNNNDISAYILKDTPTGESLVKTIKNFPIAFKPAIISGIYAYMLVNYSTIKILNLLTNESHNATGTIIHASGGGLLRWPFEIIPNNSLWTVETGSPSNISLIQVSGEDDTFEHVDLGSYSYFEGRIYDKQTQMFFNIIRTSDGRYLYKTLTDKIKITLPTNFSLNIEFSNNHCLVACDFNSSQTSYPFKISKDYGTTWTTVGNALGPNS